MHLLNISIKFVPESTHVWPTSPVPTPRKRPKTMGFDIKYTSPFHIPSTLRPGESCGGCRVQKHWLRWFLLGRLGLLQGFLGRQLWVMVWRVWGWRVSHTWRIIHGRNGSFFRGLVVMNPMV